MKKILTVYIISITTIFVSGIIVLSQLKELTDKMFGIM